ncbi:MAG: transcriptional regulator [Halothece sp. Uz-M2-17]|nr:transcriptional regulator [Halothece sp. Uz-M2-17]
MSKKLTPARRVAPGKILNRELEARDWTKNDLAERMGYSVEIIEAILKGDQQITTEIANDLGKSLETSADIWINLENNYRSELDNQARPVKINNM